MKKRGLSTQKQVKRPLLELEPSPQETTDYIQIKPSKTSIFTKNKGNKGIKFNSHFKKHDKFYNSFAETIPNKSSEIPPAEKLLRHKEYGTLENTNIQESEQKAPASDFDFEKYAKTLGTTKALRYTKVQKKVKTEIETDKDQTLFGNENCFVRNQVISNKIRSIFEKNYS